MVALLDAMVALSNDRKPLPENPPPPKRAVLP